MSQTKRNKRMKVLHYGDTVRILSGFYKGALARVTGKFEDVHDMDLVYGDNDPDYSIILVKSLQFNKSEPVELNVQSDEISLIKKR